VEYYHVTDGPFLDLHGNAPDKVASVSLTSGCARTQCKRARTNAAAPFARRRHPARAATTPSPAISPATRGMRVGGPVERLLDATCPGEFPGLEALFAED